MTSPVAHYALIATTIAQLKAIPPSNRSPNFCILVPEIGSWVYYSSSSSDPADDIHVFEPEDSVGRWLVTSRLPYFAAANQVANAAIASHIAENNPHPAYQKRSDPITVPQQGVGVVPFSLSVAVGGGSAAVVKGAGGENAVTIGSNSGNRGVISPGAEGLIIGGNASDRLSFWGKDPVTRPNAINPPGNNTADTRRAVLEIGNALRALGVIAP